MEPHDAKTHWAITRVYRTPKGFPLAEPQYVMGDCGPLLFDRQKDAVRRTSELGQSYWEVVKVRWGGLVGDRVNGAVSILIGTVHHLPDGHVHSSFGGIEALSRLDALDLG
ncbi:MAG: hypothetical protein IIB53_11785 [Planctomycetes bacterium]|nr:hypothetical protein [Planctomycetota bacterium]